MVKYRLVGSALSNDEGIASVVYTGVGRGLVDLVASTSSSIGSGSLVSQPSEVIDAIFKDRGTSSDYGTWTSTDFTGTKIERNSEYTTLIPEDTWETQSQSVSDIDLCVEFDCNLTFSEANDNYFLRFYKSNSMVSSINPLRLGLVSGQWSHIKLVRNGTTVNITVDGTSKTPFTDVTSIDQFRFIMNNAKLTNMKYKNFMIYPI